MISRSTHLAAILVLWTSDAVGGDLYGTVLLPDGAPALGAKVCAAGMFVTPSLRVETTTDAAGKFRLDVKPLTDPDNWSLCARLDQMGGEAAYGSIKVLAGKIPLPVTIRLAERGYVSGRVLQAEDDHPVAGARLFLDSGEVLSTDHDGQFRVGGLPLGDHSLIAVAAGRARPYILFDNSLRRDAQLDIRLERGGKIAGSVVDEEGQPIPGAFVFRPASGTALTLNGWEALCDAQGRFEFDGIALGRLVYQFEASAPGYEAQQHEYVGVRPGQLLEHFTFRLKRTKPVRPAEPRDEPLVKSANIQIPRRNLTGMVRSPQGIPVRAALVRWGATMYEATERETRTDEMGKFNLLDVPDRDGFVTVMADGLAPRFAPVNQGQKLIVVRLEVGQIARGIVRNKMGTPIKDVDVCPVLASPDPSLCNPLWLTTQKTSTDANGRFEIVGMPAEARFDFLCTAYSELRNVSLKLGEEENNIQLESGGAVRGLVVDPTGKPVRDFRIRVTIPRERKPGEEAGGFYAGYNWYGISFTTNDGVFVVSDVRAGAWLRLQAIAVGYGQGVVDRVQAAPLDELPPAEQLTLQLTQPHSLVVEVTEESRQKPIPDTLVTLIDSHTGLDQHTNWGYDNLNGQRGWTNSQGVAAFPTLVFGGATMLVEKAGYARMRLGWRDGRGQVLVRMAPESVVGGLVTMEARPLATFQASLSSLSDAFSTLVEQRDKGRFSFDQLPAGEYTLKVLDERHVLHTQTVSLKAGEKRELSIDVKSDRDPK